MTLQIVTVSSTGGPARIDVIASLARLLPQDKVVKMTPQAQSQRNLKLIAIAVIKYLQDHDERYPDAAKWMDELHPYLKDPSVFHDPSAPAGQK